MTTPRESVVQKTLQDFVHMSPVGMARFGDAGEIQLMNPSAVALLSNVVPGVPLENIYDVFSDAWPTLRRLVDEHNEPQRIVTDHRVSIKATTYEFHIQCSLVRVGDNVNMLVITDTTKAIKIEQQIRELLHLERRARMRVELLERCATHLAGATTVEAVAHTLIEELNKALATDIVTINVAGKNDVQVLASDRTYAAAALGLSPAELRKFQTSSLTPDLPGPAAIRTGEVIELNQRAEIAEQFPLIDSLIYGPHMESLFASPLRASGGEIIGSIVVASPEPEWLDDSTLSLLKGIADQAGLALERAKLFDEITESREREHDVALRLQSALLPSRIISHPKIDIRAAYEAASDHLMVGGDWYDTFSWPDGQIGLTVGDVAGHDIDASATMGQLRASMAALGHAMGPSPQALLTGLDQFAAQAEPKVFATSFCCVVNPSSGKLRYASAGHLPALLVDDSGARWLDGATTAPVGVRCERAEAETTVDGRWLLVLYSDGLVERPGEVIDASLARLKDHVVQMWHPTSTPSQLLDDGLLDAMCGSHRRNDDIVLLVASGNSPGPTDVRENSV